MASLWIINKAGGLIYNVDYTTSSGSSGGSGGGLASLSSNDYLILAGTLHGIHAITSRLSPKLAAQQQGGIVPEGGGGKVQDSGLQQMQANGFDMNVMATATGIKLVLLTPTGRAGGSQSPARLLQRAYVAYADHVMKNPFYTAEMPIRIESFDKAIKGILS